MFNNFTRTENIQGSLVLIKDKELFMIIDTFDPELNETTIMLKEEAEKAIDDWGLTVDDIRDPCNKIEDIISSDNIEAYFFPA